MAQQRGGQVAARRDGGRRETEQPRGPRHHARIQQPQQRALIDRPQRRIAADADEIVGVRRQDIGERRVGRAIRQGGGGRGGVHVGQMQPEQRRLRHRQAAFAAGSPASAESRAPRSSSPTPPPYTSAMVASRTAISPIGDTGSIGRRQEQRGTRRDAGESQDGQSRAILAEQPGAHDPRRLDHHVRIDQHLGGEPDRGGGQRGRRAQHEHAQDGRAGDADLRYHAVARPAPRDGGDAARETRNTQAISSSSGAAARPGRLPDRAEHEMQQRPDRDEHGADHREHDEPGEKGAAIHVRLQRDEIVLALRHGGQHQPPQRGQTRGRAACRPAGTRDARRRAPPAPPCRRSAWRTPGSGSAAPACWRPAAGRSATAPGSPPSASPSRGFQVARRISESAPTSEVTHCCRTSAQAPAPAIAAAIPASVPSPCPITARPASTL